MLHDYEATLSIDIDSIYTHVWYEFRYPHLQGPAIILRHILKLIKRSLDSLL